MAHGAVVGGYAKGRTPPARFCAHNAESDVTRKAVRIFLHATAKSQRRVRGTHFFGRRILCVCVCK